MPQRAKEKPQIARGAVTGILAGEYLILDADDLLRVVVEKKRAPEQKTAIARRRGSCLRS